MANNFYTQSGVPVSNAAGNSVDIRNEFLTIQQGFDKMPVLTGNGLNPVRVNASGAALETVALDSSGGIPGLTLFKINFKNAANTFISYFTNSNTAARTYTFPDGDGNITTDASIHAATLKTTPVAADEFGVLDSAAAFALKKITFATVKAYFDTFYAANSMIRLNTSNGYGSSGTKIRRFLTVITSQGTDITYTDDAANGASFTINTNGVYAISYTDLFNANAVLGASLNSTQLSTAIYNTTSPSSIVFMVASSANSPIASGVTLYLNAGDVIRAHTDGIASGSAGTCWFTIVRVR